MLRRGLILISYAFISIGVLVATIILVAYGQGYSYDFKTNQFTLNGLLVLGTVPSPSDIYINGRATHHKTPYRSTMPTGTYEVELRKDGYRTWRKRIDILPYQVTILSSIFLVPDQIKSEVVAPGQTVAQIFATHDRKHVAYITAEPDVGLWVLNPDRKSGTKVYTPQVATPDHSAETLVNATWSDDGSHLLIQGAIGTTVAYTLVSASGGSAPLNLTDLYKFDLAGLRFSPNDWRQLYWNSPEGLRRVDVEARTVSVVLADKVSAFTFAGDRVIYIQTTTLGKSVWSLDKSGPPKRLIESLAESDSYELQYANYRGQDALAILPAKSSIATLYLDIFSARPVSKVVSQNSNHISFSDDGHFLAFYNPNEFGTYDLDKNVLTGSRQEPGSISCLTWFDTAHVIICRKGEADLVELDGSNLTEIAGYEPGTAVFGANDQRHIYTVQPALGKSALFSSEVKK